jgi:hypothetical protein
MGLEMMVIVTGVNFFPHFFFSIVLMHTPSLFWVTLSHGVRDDADPRNDNSFLCFYFQHSLKCIAVTPS